MMGAINFHSRNIYEADGIACSLAVKVGMRAGYRVQGAGSSVSLPWNSPQV